LKKVLQKRGESAARGALLIALRLGKVSSRKGQRVAEPFVTMAAPISSSTVEYELRWLSQVQRLASLYRVGRHEQRNPGNLRAKTRFPWPSFPAPQPFVPCCLSASLTHGPTTSC